MWTKWGGSKSVGYVEANGDSGKTISIDLSVVPNYKSLVPYETLFPVVMSLHHYQTSSSKGYTYITYTYDSESGILSVIYTRDQYVTNQIYTIRAYYIA